VRRFDDTVLLEFGGPLPVLPRVNLINHIKFSNLMLDFLHAIGHEVVNAGSNGGGGFS